jgi:hypothetical protein
MRTSNAVTLMPAVASGYSCTACRLREGEGVGGVSAARSTTLVRAPHKPRHVQRVCLSKMDQLQ